MTHFLGLSGFPDQLPLVPPHDSDEDRDWYWRQIHGDLQSGRPTVARVEMSGRPVDLHLNPAALMWWYITSEPDAASSEIGTRGFAAAS